MTRLLDLAEASAEIATTGARSAKTKRVAEVLRAADVEDVPKIVAWLSGELTCAHGARRAFKAKATDDLDAPTRDDFGTDIAQVANR